MDKETEKEEMPLSIDVRGLRGQKVFEKIRETVSQYCSKAIRAEILTDDAEAVPKIRGFSSMSGCTSEVHEEQGYWRIFIQGDACACR